MSAPPFAYYGGKTSIADTIVAALPEHRHYVEPFAGGLSVLLAKPRAQFDAASAPSRGDIPPTTAVRGPTMSVLTAAWSGISSPALPAP